MIFIGRNEGATKICYWFLQYNSCQLFHCYIQWNSTPSYQLELSLNEKTVSSTGLSPIFFIFQCQKSFVFIFPSFVIIFWLMLENTWSNWLFLKFWSPICDFAKTTLLHYFWYFFDASNMPSLLERFWGRSLFGLDYFDRTGIFRWIVGINLVHFWRGVFCNWNVETWSWHRLINASCFDLLWTQIIRLQSLHGFCAGCCYPLIWICLFLEERILWLNCFDLGLVQNWIFS